MSTEKIIYLFVGLLTGFLIGFAFANGVNRKEQDALRVELTRLRSETTKAGGEQGGRSSENPSEQALSEEELRRAIRKGDTNPGDISLQRNLGRGLYLYAVNTGNASLLPDAVRMLKRAHDADPKDYETIVLLGNALFDAGQNGDHVRFGEARTYYLKALEMKPDDVNVRTDLGLTYYFDKPSDPQRAIREYRKSLAIDPRHEMTLQNLAAALITTGNHAEAEKRIGELESLNSSNGALANLRAQLAQSKNAAKERD